ncbi:hypothetical protein K450DRAFT_263195 [Umbelopsis ramanniana AG]|uniref:BZIP domain-containing protein n=1 Tax=Umbelopsis ramanniana AG TaxID=1314678 RepID=A0AAD5E277_UMBRA|nr:uncharacterized protein K450DRAFT_263195 [Umbelopsis ramanniana AG]KAI8575126.1 hypothetical protein K450DRAFT_263195 [Umbelopsis ramanniana AG]
MSYQAMDPMSLLLQHNGFYDDPIEVDQEQDYTMRKKPGRKPMPTSAAARKAQNREAQRAFRERKERHLKELEEMVKKLKVDRRATLRQRDTYKSKAEQLRIQNWYLKGLILTLQLVCMQNKVVIPPHSPFLNEESLCEIAKVLPPEVIESYVKAASPSGITKGENEPIKPEPPMKDDLYIDEEQSSPSMSPFSHSTKSPTWPTNDVPSVKQEDQPSTLNTYNSAPDSTTPPRQANLAAIQHIKMKLAMEELFTTTQTSTTGMQPTILQLAVTHDPRIDLVPTAYMRDRMILFQDLYDIDQLVETLVQGAAFMGGDPTDKMCWLVPRELVTTYWYLASSSHDMNVIGSPKAQSRLAAMGSHTGHIAVPVSPTMDVESRHGMPTSYYRNNNPMTPPQQPYYNQHHGYAPR